MYPARCQGCRGAGADQNLTERHFHTLLGVKDDRRIILVTIRSQRDGDGVILTLYGILYNGTEGDG